MPISEADLRPSRFSDWPLAVKSILGFWLVYAATVLARALLGSDPWTMLHNRWPTVAVGILLTAVVYVIINLFAGGGGGVKRKAIVAGVASLAAALVQAAVLISIDRYFKPSKEEFRYQAREGFVVVEKGYQIRIERVATDPLVLTMPRMSELDQNKQIRYIADSAVTWFFFFAAWSAFYMAILAQAEALNARRRMAEAEGAAQAAQVRALRYQINPHFLFNTLNSIATLIDEDQARAEAMVLNLSEFFRSSLAVDPTADVRLGDELALQQLYLEIERVRFSDRLSFAIHCPDDLADAQVPSLILQPLVENAIKHGVSRSEARTSIEIAAVRAGNMLRITVRDDALPARAERPFGPGTGVGLANVRSRLEARYGAEFALSASPAPPHGFQVSLELPLTLI